MNLHTEMKCELPWNRDSIGSVLGLYATKIGTGGILPIESVVNATDDMSGNVS